MTDSGRRGSAQGDEGFTDLLGQRRIPKSHPLLDAIGELDTATSALGVARRAACQDRTRRLLHQMQADLYDVMSELAFPAGHAQAQRVTDAHLAWLDRTLAAVSEPFQTLRSFVLPGASDGSAPLDLARAHVRTAERRLAHAVHDGHITPGRTLAYVNRLSLVLYYLARAEDAAAGVDLDLAGAPRERPEA